MGSSLWFHELNLLLWLLLSLYSIWKNPIYSVLSELIMTRYMNLFFNPQWRLRHYEGNMFVCACISVSLCVSATAWVCTGRRGWGGYWMLLPFSFKSLIIIMKTEASISKSFPLLLQNEGETGLALRTSSREEICNLILIDWRGLFWMEW